MDLSRYAGHRIKELREGAGMSQAELARRMGTQNQSISRYELGQRKLNQDLLFELAAIFDVTIDEFFPARDVTIAHERDPKQEARKNLVPVVGKIAAGKPTYAAEDILGYMSLPPDKQMKDSLMYLEVSSDSMDEHFPVGSYVLIDTDAQIENGDVAAVKLNGEDATLKKVKFQEDRKTVILIPESHNDDYYPVVVNIEETQLQMIGKAVGMYLSM